MLSPLLTLVFLNDILKFSQSHLERRNCVQVKQTPTLSLSNPFIPTALERVGKAMPLNPKGPKRRAKTTFSSFLLKIFYAKRVLDRSMSDNDPGNSGFIDRFSKSGMTE